VRILVGDCRAHLSELEPESAQTCITSPPYFALRDYGVEGQLGLEATPDKYVAALVEVFRAVRRVLRADGTVWLNLGDKYVCGGSGGMGSRSTLDSRPTRNHAATRAAKAARGGPRHERYDGLKPKDLIGLPWRVALALQADGWWLRSDIIWHKPNPMPESVVDRPTRAHEYVFLLSKSESYYYDADAIRTPLAAKTFTTYGSRRVSKGTDGLGRVAAHNIAITSPERRPRLRADGRPAGANRRSVWTIATRPSPFSGDHFASFPDTLVEPCVLAGAPPDGVVIDPFAGTGTTAEVALRLGRRAIAIELSPSYAQLIEQRLRGVQLPLSERTA